MGEDVVLQARDLRGRFETELLTQGSSQPLACAERGGLSAAAIQAQHLLRPQPLPQRVVVDQPLQLRDQFAVVPEREVGLDPSFDGQHPQLVEAQRFGP